MTKVARYTSFEEMFEHEPVESVNPTATREDQPRATFVKSTRRSARKLAWSRLASSCSNRRVTRGEMVMRLPAGRLCTSNERHSSERGGEHQVDAPPALRRRREPEPVVPPAHRLTIPTPTLIVTPACTKTTTMIAVLRDTPGGRAARLRRTR